MNTSGRNRRPAPLAAASPSEGTSSTPLPVLRDRQLQYPNEVEALDDLPVREPAEVPERIPPGGCLILGDDPVFGVHERRPGEAGVFN